MSEDLVKSIVRERNKNNKDWMAGIKYLITAKGDSNCRHLYFQESAEALDSYFTCNKCNQVIYMLPGKDYADFIKHNREFIDPELIKINDKLNSSK